MNNDYQIDLKVIGKNIKTRREDLGLSQDDLAEIAGLGSKARISQYEKGKHVFNIEVLVRLAKALNCEPDYLLGIDPFPERETSEIGKQIPLSESAVKCLMELNYMCAVEREQGVNPPRYAIKAALISKLIAVLHYDELMDETNKVRWSVDTMMREIWESEIKNTGIFTDSNKMGIRYSISQAFGSVVYDCIVDQNEEVKEAIRQAEEALKRVNKRR